MVLAITKFVNSATEYKIEDSSSFEKSHPVASEDNCSICLESLSLKERKIAFHDKNKATHAFHETCIEEWFKHLNKKAVCPLCNNVNLNTKEVVVIDLFNKFPLNLIFVNRQLNIMRCAAFHCLIASSMYLTPGIWGYSEFPVPLLCILTAIPPLLFYFMQLRDRAR